MQEVTPKVVAMAELLESREELFQKTLHLFIDSSRGFKKKLLEVKASVYLVMMRLDIACGFLFRTIADGN